MPGIAWAVEIQLAQFHVCQHQAALESYRVRRDLFRGEPAFTVTQGDACAADYTSFGKHYKVAGNLPYQAATAIIV